MKKIINIYPQLIITGLSCLMAYALPCSSKAAAIPFWEHSMENTKKCSSAFECFQSARNSYLSGNDKEAGEKIIDLKMQYPNNKWSLKASFLQGQIALNRGDDLASSLYIESRDMENARLYIDIFLARSYVISKQHNSALKTYNNISDKAKSSPLLKEALYEKVKLLYEMGRHEELIGAVDGFLELFARDDLVAELLILKAEAGMKSKKFNATRQAMKKLLVEHPLYFKGETSSTVIKNMNKLGIRIPALNAEESYMRGISLYRAGLFENALRRFMSIAKKERHPHREEAKLKAALCFSKLKRYDEAKKAIYAFIRSREKSKTHKDLHYESLHWLSRISLRTDDARGLMAAEKKLAISFPGSNYHSKTLLYLGSYNEDKKNNALAKKRYKQILKYTKSNKYIAEARWKLGWLAYKDKNYKDAYKQFSLEDMSGLEEEMADKLIYWAGRSAESISGNADALDLYLSLTGKTKKSFYSYAARYRLEEMNFLEDSSLKNRHKSTACSDYSLSGIKNIRDLIDMTLFDYAAEEIRALSKGYNDDPCALKLFSQLSREAGDYHLANKMIHRYIKKMHLEGQYDTDPSLLEHIFPPSLVKAVKKNGLYGNADIYLVAAIIKEESAFDPDAHSPAGAIGLMQLMPETARLISRKLKIPYSYKSLKEPATNVRMGSSYLSQLERRFKGDLILSVAGYNAGPTAVARWAKEMPKAFDERIESIPYSETRYYTQRVLRSYAEFARTAGLDPYKHLREVFRSSN